VQITPWTIGMSGKLLWVHALTYLRFSNLVRRWPYVFPILSSLGNRQYVHDEMKVTSVPYQHIVASSVQDGRRLCWHGRPSQHVHNVLLRAAVFDQVSQAEVYPSIFANLGRSTQRRILQTLSGTSLRRSEKSFFVSPGSTSVLMSAVG
jgi:hypothetical protein